ncbi:MAG: alkaline phosphatase family protein, partial [Myxococcota bacterium]|nr:alkaline phosphatase family protein [Myxococcota bacterium]
MTRALLLGLDGATFELLDVYAGEGLLPNYLRWKREGAWGVLDSTNPPTTPPAWSSCVTGVNPGRHGIFDFRESFHKDPRRPLITGASMRARKIWDILGDKGRRSCILNFPVSFPPEPIEGVFVTGMMTPDDCRDYAWPDGEMERLLAAAPDYVPNVDVPRYDVDQVDNAMSFLDDLERSLDARIAAFWHYFEQEDWAFFFPTFVFHDRLGHLFWKFMSRGEGFDDHPHTPLFRPRIEALYRRFDDLVGRLLDERPEDLSLFLCSDHGFGGTKTFFEVNAWLEHLGLLVLKPQARLRSRA